MCGSALRSGCAAGLYSAVVWAVRGEQEAGEGVEQPGVVQPSGDGERATQSMVSLVTPASVTFVLLDLWGGVAGG